MSENGRDNHGHFQAEHADQEYLAAVAEHEPAGTAEIAATVGVTRQNADRRLRRLREAEQLSCKKIGTALVWTLEDGVVARHVDPADTFWETESFAGEKMSTAEIDDVVYK